jgi:hypothetical protein
MDRDRGMDRDRDRDKDMDMSPSSQLKNQPCTVQRLYVNHSTVTPLYGTRSHRTVGVLYGP